ncbi:MAG: LysR family transcriptional regulator [Planctomyces sp.]|nr:LysR family transcriptional regulator [Planctomyces sp.]
MFLRNAEIFCDVALRRSFSKAAAARGMSQPAISQAIQQLEEHLGVTLIDRSQRPLQLTPSGEAYFEGCRKLFDDYRSLEDRVQNLSSKVTGRVRVASIYSVGLLQMVGYVARFEERYPDVVLQLDYLHPDEVYDRLVNDEADVGLVSFPKDGGEIECIPWIDQVMGVVVPPGHRLASLTEAPLTELDGEDFVAFTQDLRIRKETDRMLRKHKVSVSAVHHFDNVENIKRAVEIGAGISILPLPTVRREVDAGLLKAVPLAGLKWHRPLGIVKRRHKHLSTAAARFVDLLHEPSGTDDPWTKLVPATRAKAD